MTDQELLNKWLNSTVWINHIQKKLEAKGLVERHGCCDYVITDKGVDCLESWLTEDLYND